MAMLVLRAIDLRQNELLLQSSIKDFIFMLKYQFQFHLKEYLLTFRKHRLTPAPSAPTKVTSDSHPGCVLRQMCITFFYSTMSQTNYDETSSQSYSARHGED